MNKLLMFSRGETFLLINSSILMYHIRYSIQIYLGGIFMKSKRLLSIVIATVVTLGTTTTAFASPMEEKLKLMQAAGEIKGIVVTNPELEQKAKINKDMAREIGKAKLKEYLDYELDETKFQGRIEFRPYYYNTKDDYVWDMNWSANDAFKSININVSVNANTGEVVGMRRYEYSKFEQQPSIPSITQDKAKEVAEFFLKKVNAEKFKSTKLAEDNMNIYGGYPSVNYSFNYQRQVNGVLLDGDFIRVEVDGVSGKVLGYESKWSENLQLPSADAVMEKEKAEDIFREQTKMNLMYINYRSKYDYEFQSNAVKLVYNMENSAVNGIDAKNGTVIEYPNPEIQQGETRDLTVAKRAEWLKKAGEVKAAASEIDSARAQQVILETLKGIFGVDYKLEYLTYEENSGNYDTNGRKAWRANFYREVDGKRAEENGSVVIDALTESIIMLYKYDNDYRYDEVFTPKLTWNQAYDAAIEAAAKYFPDKIENLKTEAKHVVYKRVVNGNEIPEREYYFNFPRLSNGIIYGNDSINIAIDAKTGAFRQINCRWTDNMEFPSPNGAIGADDAESIIFERNKPELVYAMTPSNGKEINPSTEYKLIYRLKPLNATYMPGYYIDAFSGKMLNYDGQEVIEQSSKFAEKIKGHKAEKELSILAFQGIIDTNNFELDKKVTMLDFVKMLVDAKGYRPYLLREAASLKYSNVAADSANYKYLQMAVYYGILENKEGEFDFEEKVTRQEMATALIKLLGYENLAKVKDIFVLKVDDRSEMSDDNLGYMAIAKALGILEVENAKIRPADNATMVEMSLAVYKVLGNLRNGTY